MASSLGLRLAALTLVARKVKTRGDFISVGIVNSDSLRREFWCEIARGVATYKYWLAVTRLLTV